MQKKRRVLLYILILITGFAWIVISADRSSPTGKTSAPQTGFTAPDFTLQTPGSEEYTLTNFKGSAVLINLWATWCPPCRAEMPAIEKMYREYGPQGLVVLAVDMTYQDDPAKVAPFIQEYGLTFPILLDQTGTVGALYQLRSLPSSYFINRTGVIQEVVIGGPMSEALLRTRIEQILK